MVNSIIFLLSIMVGQNNDITSDILNEDFSIFKNEYCIAIDQNSSYDFGISYRYNYYLPPESANSYRFMDQTVQKAGFSIQDNNSIDEVVLFLEVYDIDLFYQKLVEEHGRPEITSLSESYLEKHGYKIPPDFEDFDAKVYDSVPVPEIVDYKILKNVNWYEVNSAWNKVETNLIVRNQLKLKVMDVETHEVQIIFRKATI